MHSKCARAGYVFMNKLKKKPSAWRSAMLPHFRENPVIITNNWVCCLTGQSFTQVELIGQLEKQLLLRGTSPDHVIAL